MVTETVGAIEGASVLTTTMAEKEGLGVGAASVGNKVGAEGVSDGEGVGDASSSSTMFVGLCVGAASVG